MAFPLVSNLSNYFGPKQQSQTSTQTSTPWSGLQPFLTDVFGRAQGLSGTVYGGPYIAPQSPYSAQAIQQQAANATDPNSLVSQAQQQLGQTLGGQYLSPTSNPYLQGTLDQLTGNALRATNQQFSGDNFGSSANREWLGRNIVNATAPYLSGLYSQERSNQLNAISQAPGLQMANTAQLAGAGAAQEARRQAEIQAAQQQTYAPWTPLQNYASLLSAGQGYGTQTTQTPYYTNPAGSALGGGLAGFQLTGSPYGALIGAGLGLLSAG